MKSNPLLKPSQHLCCSHGPHLRIHALNGSWAWHIALGGMTLPVAFCPFCGVKLPREGKARIRLVKS